MRPIFVEPLVPASISVSSALADFPAANLLTRQPSEVCRASAGTGDVDIDFAFGEVTSLTAFALLFHTEQQGSLELYGANSAAGLNTAPRITLTSVFAGTIDPGFGTRTGMIHLDSPETFSHWRLRVTGRASGDFEAGRLVVGSAFQSTKSLGYGLQPESVDGGVNRAGVKGARFVDVGPVRSAFNISFDVLTEDDFRQEFWPLINRLGQTRPLFFCADPADTAARELMSIYGTLGRVRSSQRYAKRWRAKLKINGL